MGVEPSHPAPTPGQYSHTVRRLSVVRLVVASLKLSKIDYSYYETLLGSGHRWFCCPTQILPQTPCGIYSGFK